MHSYRYLYQLASYTTLRAIAAQTAEAEVTKWMLTWIAQQPLTGHLNGTSGRSLGEEGDHIE